MYTFLVVLYYFIPLICSCIVKQYLLEVFTCIKKWACNFLFFYCSLLTLESRLCQPDEAKIDIRTFALAPWILIFSSFFQSFVLIFFWLYNFFWSVLKLVDSFAISNLLLSSSSEFSFQLICYSVLKFPFGVFFFF
jgi:hypothetical protein